MPVQNAEIAAMFDQTADLLEVKGENQFRVRAYRRAARTIEGLPQSVCSMLTAETDLSELPGIGKDLAGKITDIVKTGRFELLETLKKNGVGLEDPGDEIGPTSPGSPHMGLWFHDPDGNTLSLTEFESSPRRAKRTSTNTSKSTRRTSPPRSRIASKTT